MKSRSSIMFHMLKGQMKGDSTEYVLLQFDGASDPNPGRSSAGAVLLDKADREMIGEAGEYIEYATNNQAEYRGLRLGLSKAIQYGIKELLIEGDSNLIVQQVAGIWKVNHPALKEEYQAVNELMDAFEMIGIRHVPREKNQKADSITKHVLQSQLGYEVKNRKSAMVLPPLQKEKVDEKKEEEEKEESVKEQLQKLSNEIHGLRSDVKEMMKLLQTLI